MDYSIMNTKAKMFQKIYCSMDKWLVGFAIPTTAGSYQGKDEYFHNQF